MLSSQIVYIVAGVVVFAVGLRGALLHPRLLGQVVSFNIGGVGVFMVFVALAFDGAANPADPVRHALVLTGIVVAVSATAFALALIRRLDDQEDE